MPTNITTAQETQLRRMVGEAHKPDDQRMLSDADLDVLAGEVGKIKDSADEAPLLSDGSANPDYTLTVDLYRIAAEGWRVKAGMVAEGYDFRAEGAEFNRSQVYKHYLDQAARYAAMASMLSPKIGRPAVESTDADAFEEWLAGGGGI